MSETMKDADDRAVISTEVLAALGLSRDEAMNMGLRTFFDLATDKGYDVVVSSRRALTGEGRLLVSIEGSQWPEPPSPLALHHKEG